MKKRILPVIAIFLAVSLLSSCAHIISSTHEINLDKSNPIENNVLVVFDSSTSNGWFVLREWNGIYIQEGLYTGKKV